MPTPAPSTTRLSYEDEQWLEQMEYAFLPAEEAAADPRTPERHIMRTGYVNDDQFFALTTRRPISDALGRWLVDLVYNWPGTMDRNADAIVAVTALPQCRHTYQLLRLAQSLWRPDRRAAAVAALASHPVSTDEVVAWALHNCVELDVLGDLRAANSAAAAAGSLVPYARQLTRGQRHQPDRPYGRAQDLVDEVVAMCAELNGRFPDPSIRKVAAQIAATFTGTPDELVVAVAAATHTAA